MDGWIKLHRRLLEWEWYDEPNTFRLFMHLLLKANHKPKKYRGVIIETGQVMTGLNLLSEQTGLSVRNIRTSLKHLKATNEVTSKTSSQGSIIQIVNYSKYQIVTSEVTTDRQASDKQVTTNNNDKKEKKGINIPSKRDFMRYAELKDPDYKLKQNRILIKYEAWIENDWKDGNNKPIKNWKTKLLHQLAYIKKDYVTKQQRL